MLSFSKCILLAFLAVSSASTVSAAAVHHGGRIISHHRAVAEHLARAPIPEPQPLAVANEPSSAPRRRSRRSNGKCKAPSTSATKTSSTVHLTSTSHSITATTHSAVSTTNKATQTSTSEAVASSSSSPDGPSYMSGTQTGDGTYYGTGLGACGITNTDTDYIAAVSHLLFDTYPGYAGTNPNDNPLCNRKVKASYNGNEVIVAITDRCTACNITDLDFSPSAFSQLANQAVGRIHGMTWVWTD